MESLTHFRIEPLSSAHIEAVLAVERASQSAPWSETSFRNEFENAQSIFLVGLESGVLVGYAGLWKVVDEAHIINVAVDPARRNQGIGCRLVVEALLRARTEGMLCATLEVRASNEIAIRLYERLGFVRAAVRRAYYSDNHEDAIVMWLYDLTHWNPNP
jgi:ribosomal-protein-alanine N-acetyltransferase